VYVDQQIVPTSIRRSPIQFSDGMVGVFPAPTEIKTMPMNEIMTPYQILRCIFSMSKTELNIATKRGVVAKIREELPAVVRNMP
jgi:hypothetical protein